MVEEKVIVNGVERPDDWDTVDHWKNMSLENVKGEIWVSVKGFKGYYEVSNMGRVKSLKRATVSEKISKQSESDERGYVRVSFTENGRTEHKYVHILVGRHFIANPDKKRTVNHLFGNKKDNRVTSLGWATYSENHKHSYEFLGRKSGLKGKTGYDSVTSKEILCVTTGHKYGSLMDASRALNLSFQNISKVCKGKRHHTGEYVFKFIEEE